MVDNLTSLFTFVLRLIENVYQVRRKDFWLLSTVNKLLAEFIPRLSHDADGLIFQVIDDQKQFTDLEILFNFKSVLRI